MSNEYYTYDDFSDKEKKKKNWCWCSKFMFGVEDFV